MLLSDLLPAAIAWQPSIGDVVLLAADRSDLAIVETVLETLPAKARGQVFIEVDSMDEMVELSAPGRVCVTWLSRERGQSLRAAVDAWTAEMLPVHDDHEYSVYAWMSGDHVAHVLTSN